MTDELSYTDFLSYRNNCLKAFGFGFAQFMKDVSLFN